MAKLNTAGRKRLPKSEFSEPGQEKYPMPDWQHAPNAKSRARQMLNAGKLSREEYEKICARANHVMAREKND